MKKTWFQQNTLFFHFVLSSLSIDLTDLSLSGAVTAADTVTLVLSNNSGGSINLGAAVAYCMVIKKP